MSDIAITVLYAPKASNYDKIGRTEQARAILEDNVTEIVGHFLNTRTSRYPEFTAPARITSVVQTASAKQLSSLDLLVQISVRSDHNADKRIELQDVICDTIRAIYSDIKVNAIIRFGAPNFKLQQPRTINADTEAGRSAARAEHAQLVTKLMIKTNEHKNPSDALLVNTLASSEA